MKPITLAGLVLVVIGIIALVYQGFTYTTRETVIDIGPIHATAEREKTFPLPPVLGIVAVAGGIAVMMAGARKGASSSYSHRGAATRHASPSMTDTRFRQTFLLLLVAAISVAFVAMLRAFLLTILLAAIFTALSYPMYGWFSRVFRGRSMPAAIVTLLVLVTLVMGPLLAVLGAGANEALRVSEIARPHLERIVQRPGEFNRRLRAVPGYHFIEPYRAQIFIKAGELVGSASAFIFGALSATTRASAVFIFHFVILLYTMFFFFTDGPALLEGLLAKLPLTDEDKQRMLEKFVSVTRATLKGTVLIGIAQGTLGGLAFWAAGIDGAIFWGTVMTVLSIIPGIGGALIWIPAALILMTTGEVWRGIALGAFCGLAIGSVDNLLRPLLVGRDTQLHELLIFFSTLGGLMMFGVMGFIVGPILAALFVTVWDMFAVAFRSSIAAPQRPMARDADA